MSNSKHDPYEGVGGSYVVDPKTGERKRVEGPSLPGDPAAEQAPKSKPAPRRSTESQE